MRRARFLPIALAMAVASPVARARADVRDECAGAAERAEEMLASSSLVGARDKLLFCARDVCPRVVRADCRRWLADVDARLPSVVVSAHEEDGKDISDAVVSIDGKVVGRTDGKAFAVDPGPRVLSVASASGAARDESIVVREGQKMRLVEVTLRRGPAAATATAAPASSPSPTSTSASTTSSPAQQQPAQAPEPPARASADRDAPPAAALPAQRVLAGASAAVGVAALVASAVFGLRARAKWSEAHDDHCQPGFRCDPTGVSLVSDAQSAATIATVAAAIGVVAVGGGVVLWITAPSSSPRGASALGVTGTF